MTTFSHSISYVFANEALLTQALTHKSFFNENGNKAFGHNEKLEFLGDAVLDLSLSHILYERWPDLDEGHLSKLRASLVNETALDQVARTLNLPAILMLGRGEERSGGREKPRLLASALEAVIGAVYLDGGFGAAHGWIKEIFESAMANLDLQNHYSEDFKTRLQERAQELFKQTPEYVVIDQKGPDHEKVFVVEVLLQSQVLAVGEGRSKKQAEQCAAERALEKIK